MWKRFARVLRCPLCSGSLSLSIFEDDRPSIDPEYVAKAKERKLFDDDFQTYVKSGTLSCTGCKVHYPVYEGLPIMLPYTTQLHQEFSRTFGDRLPKDYRFADRQPVPGEKFVLSSFSTEWLSYDFDGVIWEMDYTDHEKRFLSEIGSFRPERADDMFLELGCGIGITTHLAQKNFGVDAVGVDLSLASMRAAVQYRANPFLHFAQASVFYLPFAEGAFGTVYSRGVLHHTFSTEKAFASLAKFARPGGATYLWVYGPRSINDNALRRTLFAAETGVRKALSGRDHGLLANVFLWPLATAYMVFNHSRRLQDPTIQPYTFKRALHAARDRFTPEFAHRHTDEEVRKWFREAGYIDIEVVDWHTMPSADHDDYRRNTGVRGYRTKR
jgi:SAM-dependent methyltransferase